MKVPSTIEARGRAISASVLLALLVSCGGGVDSGGTGAPASLAAGPISGLGSVIVNGVRFDDSAASIVDQDGNVLTADQLQVGMSALIDASAIVSGGTQATASALTIRSDSEIIGPVDSVNAFGTSLVVLGQPVRITVATWFDSALPGAVQGLTTGDVVEVWGQYNARTGEYVATRVAPRANASSYEIRGPIAAVDAAAKTLTVGGLVISDAAADLSAMPTLAVGKFVRAKLDPAPIQGVWNASVLAPGNRPLSDRPDARVAGRISNVISPSLLELNGIAVDISGAAFPAGSAGVVLGARVVVLGSTSGGVLDASSVTVVGDETAANSVFEVHGLIATLDPARQSFTVRGVTVQYGAQTQYLAGTVADLSLGRHVDVTGVLDGNRMSIDAQVVDFGP